MQRRRPLVERLAEAIDEDEARGILGLRRTACARDDVEDVQVQRKCDDLIRILDASRINAANEEGARALLQFVHGVRRAATRRDAAVTSTAGSSVKSGNVSACCAGRQKHTGGVEFEFAEALEAEVLDGEEWRDVVV